MMHGRITRVLFLFLVLGGMSRLPLFPEARIKVAASIFPLAEFAREVLGERGEVTVILPPGADIHSWQPRPSDIIALSSADVFLLVGAHLEPWADSLVRGTRNPSLRILEVSRELELIREAETHGKQAHAEVDPHLWLDLGNDIVIVERLVDLFSEMDPGKASFYRERGAAYSMKLREMDEKYRRLLERCRNRTLVVGGHAAFGYLARRYGLEQISLYGLSPDSMPAPGRMMDVIRLVRERGIRTIFFETNVPDDLARVIARETGAGTLVLNTGVSLSREQREAGVTFLDIMTENLDNLRDGLFCR